MKAVCGIAYATFVVIFFRFEQTALSSCTRFPIITGYSRPYGLSVSTYRLTWQLLTCDQIIFQFQIQVTGSCSTVQPVTILTGSNKTSTDIVIASCAEGGCYARVRAELSNSVYSPYSACVRINNDFIRNERHAEQYSQDICVLIQGICGSGSISEFFINGHMTQWPHHGNTQYNVTYSSSTSEYSFCFVNVTENIIITEYCYQQHLASCSLCSTVTGEINFLSRSDIFIVAQGDESVGIISPSSVIAMALIQQLEATTLNMLISKAHSIIYTSTPVDKDQLLEFDMKDNTFSVLLIGTTSIGAACTLIGMVMLIIPIGLWYRRGTNGKAAVNIYDEPSLPDPIYQEVNIKMAPEAKIQMIGNDSYVQVAHKTN